MWIKTLSGICGFIALPSGSIYMACRMNDNLNVFNFEGSSSMKPLIEILTDGDNITFSPIGSNAALRRVILAQSEFALVSHDVSEMQESAENKDSWNSRQLKVIPLAKEPILLVYKAPVICSDNFILNKDNIYHVYSIFSGHIYPDIKDSLKRNLKDLMSSTNDACNVEIVPWVKNVTPNKSGTAKSFINNPIFSNISSGNTGSQNWMNQIKNSYGSEVNLNYTPESTLLHWESFISNLKEGSMTYFPGSFVIRNWDLFVKNKLKIASLQLNNENIDVNKENYPNDKYTWNRVFNLVYSESDISSNTTKNNMVEKIKNSLSKISKLNLVSVSKS